VASELCWQAVSQPGHQHLVHVQLVCMTARTFLLDGFVDFHVQTTLVRQDGILAFFALPVGCANPGMRCWWLDDAEAACMTLQVDCRLTNHVVCVTQCMPPCTSHGSARVMGLPGPEGEAGLKLQTATTLNNKS